MARKLLLIIFALLIAGSTVWFVRNWAGNQGNVAVQQPAEAPQVVQKREIKKILVAAQNLPAGTLVRENHVKWQEWPETDGLEEQYVVENSRPVDEFYGTVVRSGLSAGEPITDSRMVKPGQQGFLAAVLKPGKRAVSIQVDETTGVAGFIFPGDRVDVILTLEIIQENTESSRPRHASETILSNVRVVAMDQSTDDQEQQVVVRRIATLEVTPKQVEKISVSRALGRLSLSLRSIATSGDSGETGGFTWDSDASSLIAKPAASGKAADKVMVIRGGDSQSKEFK
ncbi:Flp pilus assembly protein CpaB [Sneathiella sp. P13V-1]|uniref:Flp pilus assembly protein CpaB n=1 Tax=Sneathiella sp. P13V-1 TaxID=2697366 RepID=UPI00187B152A|nr:Flp pilus assembly protein CpaB [Sneathiella sp. P13V-1]MBE7637852.1 Flp pilus assembly protein CpaB [Sneathiella sp. P13V-1]